MIDRSDNPALTSLRFIAASCIALTHYFKPLGLHLGLAPVGMLLFFCLCGFVIHYSYAARLSANWLATALAAGYLVGCAIRLPAWAHDAT